MNEEEYLNVKVIVTDSVSETTYEMKRTDRFIIYSKYEEDRGIPFKGDLLVKNIPELQSISFSMRPLRDDNDLLFTVTTKPKV